MTQAASSTAWSWRHAFAQSSLPATTKHVLHTLGMFMNELGEGCYPSVADICRYSGLDKKTVLKHLAAARDAGWIAVSQHGYRGQKWKRQEYAARWPERDLVAACAPDAAEQGGGAVPPPSEAVEVVDFAPQGGGIEGSKVVEQVHQDKTSPVTTPITTPSQKNAREGVKGKEGQPDRLPPSETPGRADFTKRVQRFCTGKGFQAGEWPNWDSVGFDSILRAFANLSTEDRAHAERWRDPYLLSRPGRKGCQFVGVFLNNKAWETFSDDFRDRADELVARARVASPSTERVKPWGPLWGQMVMHAVLDGPVDPGPAAITRESRAAAYDALSRMVGPERAQDKYRALAHDFADDGTMLFPDDFDDRVWRDHVADNGWPRLRKLYDDAAERRFPPVPVDFEHRSDLMEAVPVGTATFAAWKAHFQRVGCPWLPDPGQQPVVFFPKGGPDGLEVFEAAIRGKGGDNDGDEREAAE